MGGISGRRERVPAAPRGKFAAATKRNAKLRAALSESRKALAGLQEQGKGLRLSEEKFRLLFENCDDAVLHIDRNGIIIDANSKVEEFAGRPRRELVGQPFTRFGDYKSDTTETLLRFFKEAVDHDVTYPKEVELFDRNGKAVVLEPSINRIKREGQVEGLLVQAKDITERKRSQEKLAEMYRLERDLRRQIEAEMKRRIDFSRILAHELKTPLTPVLASIESLLSELDDERLSSLAANIARGAHNLNRRIDELLDLERGDAGLLELNRETLDLLQLVREAADSVAPVAAGHRQSLSLDLPPLLPRVKADESRLQQVLLNLLNNAVKFTPRGGKITLKARDKNGSVVVEVRDTGRGIPRERLARVFEPYHHLPHHEERPGGLGLGLALCKTLVELHGGRIWARSRPGKGSTFAFSLPVAPPAVRGGASRAAPSLWKVLVVEDDQEITDSISLAFERNWPEAKLISAKLGEEGLDLVEGEEPDVVLLDLVLPDMHGLDVLKAVRRFSRVPVVILSARDDEGTLTRTLELGANDYVTKPFRKMELLARLKVQVRREEPMGETAPIVCGSLRFDPATCQLTCSDREIDLTAVEGRIMHELIANAGHVRTYARLAEAVLGRDWEEHPDTIRSLRVHIRHIRSKIEADPGKPNLILTKSGVGYRLAAPG